MDGIVPLDEVDTLLGAWASSLEDDDEPPGLVPDDEEDEVLLVAMARTVKQRRNDPGESKCRVSGAQDQTKRRRNPRNKKAQSTQREEYSS